MLSKDLERIEREETMRQDADLRRRQQQAQGGTFFQHGLAQADEVNQGRFAATGVPTVTGATPVPKYPAASAAHQTELPPEPPLGYSVNDFEPSTDLSAVEATGGAPSSYPLEDVAAPLSSSNGADDGAA
jgi:hypothetical protein